MRLANPVVDRREAMLTGGGSSSNTNISSKTGAPKVEPKGALAEWFNMYNDRTEMSGGLSTAGLSADDNRAKVGGMAMWGDPIIHNRTIWDMKYVKEEEGGFNPLGQLDAADLRRKIARDNEILRTQSAKTSSIQLEGPKAKGPPPIKSAPEPEPAYNHPSVAGWAKGKEVPPGSAAKQLELLKREAEPQPPPPSRSLLAPPPPPPPEKPVRMEWQVVSNALWSQRLEALQSEAAAAAAQERMALQAFHTSAGRTSYLMPAPPTPVSFPSLPRMSDKVSTTYVSRYQPAVEFAPPPPPPPPPTAPAPLMPPPRETMQPTMAPPPPTYAHPDYQAAAAHAAAMRFEKKQPPPPPPPPPPKQKVVPTNIKNKEGKTRLSSEAQIARDEELAKMISATSKSHDEGKKKSPTRISGSSPVYKGEELTSSKEKEYRGPKVPQGAQRHAGAWQQLQPTA